MAFSFQSNQDSYFPASSSLFFTTFELNIAPFLNRLLILLRACAFSLTRSAIMSRAPARASSVLFTPFSPFTYLAANCSMLHEYCFCISLAKDSSPRSMAIVARVLRFGLYGRYRSSSSVMLLADRICFSSSGVILPCSVIEVRMASRRLSSSFNFKSKSRMAVICTSFRPPVTSFR